MTDAYVRCAYCKALRPWRDLALNRDGNWYCRQATAGGCEQQRMDALADERMREFLESRDGTSQ